MLGLTYTVGMLSITVGYHRYFSHKTFRTNRAVQFVMGFLGCCQLQGGPIAWSAVHRHHHRHSDLEADLHSPVHGFYNAHVGWLLNPRTYQVAFKPLQDLSSCREIVWLDRYNFIPAVLALCLLYLVGELNAHRDPASTVDGLFCLYWGGILRTVLVWHATWSVNSICHCWGSQSYDARDQSRNNFWVALLVFGEGWHNNHHRFPSRAKSGVCWWQLDVSYAVIVLLQRLGLVWNVRGAQSPKEA